MATYYGASSPMKISSEAPAYNGKWFTVRDIVNILEMNERRFRIDYFEESGCIDSDHIYWEGMMWPASQKTGKGAKVMVHWGS